MAAASSAALRMGAAGVLAAWVATGCAAREDAQAAPDPALAEAAAALGRGDATAALTLLERGESAGFAAQRLRQDALCSSGRADLALAEARARVAAQGDADAHVLLARLLEDAEARALLARALELDPRHAWAQCGLGTLAARAHDLEEAERHFTRALAADARLAIAARRRAEVRERLGDYRGAERDLRAWLKVAPADRDAIFALATLLHRDLDRGREAEELYRLLLDLDPGSARALVSLGVRRMESGDTAGAERLYRAAAPAAPTAWFNLGLLYMQQGDARLLDARRCFERFLEQADPGTDAADRVLYAPLLLDRIDRLLGASDAPTALEARAEDAR